MIIDADGWLDAAARVPSPNFNERPPDTPVDLVVVHNISLPPRQFGGPWIEDFFLNRLDPAAHPYFAEIHELCVSAHLLIRRTGKLVQFVSFLDRAWHAGVSCWNGREACNDFSVGIELEGSDDQPFQEVQYQALDQVLNALQQRFPSIQIPATLAGHSEIAPGRKTDPGPCFDWKRYRPGGGPV